MERNKSTAPLYIIQQCLFLIDRDFLAVCIDDQSVVSRQGFLAEYIELFGVGNVDSPPREHWRDLGGSIGRQMVAAVAQE